MESATRYLLSVGSVVVVVIGIFIACFSHIITFVGTNDNREHMKKSLNRATITTLVGTAMGVIAAIAFYQINPAVMMHILLFMVFMGFGLAWAACAIALIKRK